MLFSLNLPHFHLHEFNTNARPFPQLAPPVRGVKLRVNIQIFSNVPPSTVVESVTTLISPESKQCSRNILAITPFAIFK